MTVGMMAQCAETSLQIPTPLMIRTTVSTSMATTTTTAPATTSPPIPHSTHWKRQMPPSTSRDRHSKGSRLQALREQLQREHVGKMKQPPSLSIRQRQSMEQAPLSTTTVTSPIRAMIDALPDIPFDVVLQHTESDSNNTKNKIEPWQTQQQQQPHLLLRDRYQRGHNYLRISLTERCNLRCTYCMPEEGVPLQPAEHLLSTGEILHLAQYFAKHGVNKYRLTGGEPTLRKDLVDIVRGLAHLQPHSIGITTNGVILDQQWEALVEAGLTSVNISLDTLQREKFPQISRRPATYLDRVLYTLDRCLQSAADHRNLTVKINCVVMRGVNDEEVVDFIRYAQERHSWYFGDSTTKSSSFQVRFIEYMPFTGTGWDWNQCVPYTELLERAQQANLPLQPVPSDDFHDTTKWYTLASATASSTTNPFRIGFITSMSDHFCAGCNRLRLTADGKIKVCLFDGQSEVSLRDAIRLADATEHDLNKLVYWALQKKHFSLGGHSGPEKIQTDQNRPMILIGG